MRARMGRRLDAMTAGAIERGYRRVAAMWAEGIEGRHDEALALLKWLSEEERARGTSLAGYLDRLPHGLREGVREALARSLEGRR